jgi:peptide/nickel transport system substrate-binding protein
MSRRIIAGVAVLGALSLGLTACGSSPKPTSSGTAATTLTMETNPIGPYTDNFNPFDSTSTGDTENTTGLVYEPLLQWNITKPNSYTPWLASSFTWNSTGTSITFDIRSGVKWSDGTAFTAKDVAYTFQLMENNKALNTYGLPITGTTSSGDTATISFSQAEYSNLYAISGEIFIVPEHIWSKQSDPQLWPDPSPVGTGPFEIDRFAPQGYTLKANKNYWQGAPKVQEISVPAYSSNTTANQALENGQIDWAGNDVSNIQNTYIDRDKTDNHYWFPATNTVIMVYNVTTAPFNDVAVRKAVSDAIDRSQLSSVGEEGYEAPATSDSGLLLPNFTSEVPSNLADDISATSNTSAVTSVMTAAGYALDSHKIWAKGGREVTFTIEDPSSYTDYYEDANLIKSQLGPLGFNVSVNGVTPNKWAADLGSGQFQASIHWGTGGPTPFTQYDSWLDYTTSAPIGQTANGDLGRYDSPAVQAALKNWASTNSASQITTDLDTVANAMATDVPDAVLLYGAGWNEYSTKKFTGWPTTSNSYNDPRPNDPFLEVTILHLTPVS